jgi:hypothetical protein
VLRADTTSWGIFNRHKRFRWHQGLHCNDASPESYSDNVYLNALLWLTPTNPFGTVNHTTIDFSFGSAGSFTGGVLSGDANEDGKADFQIELTGVTALNWSHDVVLA